MKRRMTESLVIDLQTLEWQCSRCGHSLGPAGRSYKEGCLVATRSPAELWRPFVKGRTTFTYDPGWARLVEFYCPECACMIEVEMLPPGHPITHDIELDLSSLKNLADSEAGSDAE